MTPLPPAATSHYLAGKLAMYREDWAAAADELALAAKAAPDQPMIAVEEARALAKAKRPDEARDVLAATRANWPEHEQVWLASGEILEKTAPADAAKAYKRAIELDRTDERPYLGLARAELLLEHPRRAESTLRDLVIRVPSSVDGHYRLAQRQLARGALTDAIVQLRAVLERDPDHLDARLDLARALRRTGDLQGAIEQTRSAFDRAGQPMDIAEELFWLLCEADDLQGAIDLLTLLDDDRSDAESLASVARLDIGLGRIDAAEGIAQRLQKMDADLAELVEVELALARHDTAAADASAAKIKPGTDAAKVARAMRALAALDNKDVERATRVLKESPAGGGAKAPTIDPAPADPDETFLRARLEEAAHNRSAAIGILEMLVRSRPDDIAALNMLGYLLADSRTRLPEAERYLRRARELAPGDPAILDSWGWLLLAEGKPREALRALDHAARLAPRQSEILAHRAAAQQAVRDTMRP